MIVLRAIDRLAGSTGLRVTAAVAVALLVAVTILPAEFRPHTPYPGRLEDFGAYFSAALVLSLIGRPRRTALFAILALCALAGVLEFLQGFTPTRHPQFFDFIAKGSGATVGGLLIYLARGLPSQAGP